MEVQWVPSAQCAWFLAGAWSRSNEASEAKPLAAWVWVVKVRWISKRISSLVSP